MSSIVCVSLDGWIIIERIHRCNVCISIFAVSTFITIMCCASSATIKLENTTSDKSLPQLTKQGNYSSQYSTFCGISDYIDPYSADQYYYITSAANDILSDIYDNNLDQYNSVNNKQLSQSLPFSIANISHPTSVCTAPYSLNIIQCHYNVCSIFINALTKWTSNIPVGCDQYNSCINGVSVSCFNDGTFFLLYQGAEYNEMRYTMLSATGSYIEKNRFFYQWQWDGISKKPKTMKYDYGNGPTVIVSNFSIDGVTDVINSFLVLFTQNIGNTVIDLLALSGYYNNSKQISIWSTNITRIGSSGSCNPYLETYPPIVMEMNRNCCYVVPYVADDDFGGVVSGVIIDSESNNVGIGDSFAFYEIDGNYEQGIILVALSMFFVEISTNSAMIESEYGWELNAYFYELIDLQNGSYSVQLVSNDKNENVTTLAVQFKPNYIGNYCGYYWKDSSSLMVSWSVNKNDTYTQVAQVWNLTVGN